LGQLVRNAYFAVCFGGEMPFKRRDLFLGVSCWLSEPGNESSATLVLSVLLGVVERDNPEKAASEFLKLLAHPPPKVPKAAKGSPTLSFWVIWGRASV
jgi:hypothetical protein